jgi:mannose-6-phosphate isomerase-like protein (cupin superfamily)
MGIKQLLKPAIFQPTADKPAYWIGTDRITMLMTGEQTGGSYAAVDTFTVLGSGPPPHIHHREDEMFYVLDGEGTIFVGDEVIPARAGTCVHVPSGMIHHYKSEGRKPLHMVVTYTPAGFENYFLKVGIPTRQGDEVAPPVTDEILQRLFASANQFYMEILQPHPEDQ